jgi:hypothetical protein
VKIARPFTAVGVLMTAALLSGCSATHAVVRAQSHAVVKAQSQAVACAQIADELKAARTGIYDATVKLSTDTDPTSVAAAVSADAYKFSVAANKISNVSVKKAAEKAAIALGKFSNDLTTYANIGATPQDEANLHADVTPLQTTFRTIETTCNA